MTFHCPSCSLDTLELLHSLSLPPDDGFSDRAVQFLHCSICDFSAVGFYNERHQPTDEIDHFSFRIPSGSSAKRLKELLSSCSTPDQKDCSCTAHTFFAGNTVQNSEKVNTEFRLDSMPMPLSLADGTSNTDDLPDYLF